MPIQNHLYHPHLPSPLKGEEYLTATTPSDVLRGRGAYLSVREDLFVASIWRYDCDLAHFAPQFRAFTLYSSLQLCHKLLL